MTFYKFFKAKHRKDAQRSSTSDLDTSAGILAPPFPPLLCRAKSPSDILDFVGYPRLQVRHHPSPLPLRQVSSTNAPLTIRNKTPETTAVEQVAQSSAPTVVQTTAPLLTSAPPPRDTTGFHMPTPKKAIAPTWRILNTDQAEKTLIAEDPVKLSGDSMHVNRLQQQVMEFERERQAWARQEEKHRQLEQQMLQRIQDNQAKIDQLSNLPPKRESVSNNHSNRTSFDSFASHQQSTPSYVEDNDNIDDDEDYDDEHGDDDEYSTFDDGYNISHTCDSYPSNNKIHLDQCHRNHINNRSLLFAPMDYNQYQQIQQHIRYNDIDSDDDDDNDGNYQHNNAYIRQRLPYLEDADYGDDDDDDDQDESPLDDTYQNQGPWQHPHHKAVYYDYWRHPPSRSRPSSIHQREQQRGMIYYPQMSSHSLYYQQQQRPTSAHVLQEHHHRKPLRRHHSFGGDPDQVYHQHQAYKNRMLYRI